MKLRKGQFGILISLIVITTITIVLTVLLDGNSVDNEEPLPGDPIDTRSYPQPNILNLPLESNYTNLITGSDYILSGNYLNICTPYFNSGATPNYNYGTFLYLPCSTNFSTIITDIIIPSTFTLSLWVSPQSSIYSPIINSTNLNLLVKYDTATIASIELSENDPGTWTFIVITLQNNLLGLYVNDNYTSTLINLLPTGNLNIIGSLYNGGISTVNMWNYVLSQNNITNLYELS
jgi:hypothetical protein